MNKYIIVGVVIIAGILVVSFLFRSQGSLNKQLTDAGNNISVPATTPVPADNLNKTNDTQTINNDNKQKTMTATLSTSMGDITVEFFDKEAPKTVANFMKLAKENFYNGIKFHRVIKGFMIQGGDPLTKDDSKMNLWGTGGPGYKFADEIDAKSDLYTKVGYKKGILAMANSGPNTNGSQFFIMAQDYPLPSQYTIFGKVVSGQDVVNKIENTPTGPSDRPVTAVIIKNISLK